MCPLNIVAQYLHKFSLHNVPAKLQTLVGNFDVVWATWRKRQPWQNTTNYCFKANSVLPPTGA